MIEQRLTEIITSQDTAAILQLNCHRSPHVMHSLFNHHLTNNFSIIALQEPSINKIDYLPPNQSNWILISPTPSTRNEAGRPRACLYVRKDLRAALNPITSPSRDIAACTITINQATLLICNVYNAPKDFSGFTMWNSLMTSLPLTLQLLPTIVVADANLHSPLWNPTHIDTNDKDAEELLDLMTKWSLRLRSPVGVPTYGLGSSTTRGTTIDHVWVNDQLDDSITACFVDTGDITNHFSDHQSLITSFSTKLTEPGLEPQESGRSKNWNQVERPAFLLELGRTLPPITRVTSQAELDNFDRSLRKAITDALNNNSPNRSPPGKHKRWWRPEILDPLRKEAQRLHKRFKEEKSEENKLNYKKARNKFNKTVDKLKEDNWKVYLSTLTHDTLLQAKKFASGRTPSSLVSTLISNNGTMCSTNEEKSELLFHTTCVATAPCRIDDTEILNFPIHAETRPSETTMPDFISYLTDENIKSVITGSPPLKAPGADKLQNWVWQMAWKQVKTHVSTLFLQVTDLGWIPQDWKQARTVVIPKPGKPDYTAPSAYRPIALLNTLSKLYEKLLTKHLSEQVERQQLLHDGHYRGRPNKSGHEALTHLVSWIKREWSRGNVVGALFADVKSAFPSVHHPRLLNILEKKGFHSQTVNLLHNFLHARRTTLAFDGFESKAFELTHGLPQGSPLSPLLYLLYNNALLEFTDKIENAAALGFIDDVVLLTAGSDTHRLRSQMQTLAYRQNIWAKDHGAIFDTKKTFWVIFDPRDRLGGREDLPTINFVDRKNILPEEKARWLGITIDDKLTFAQHRTETIAKGTQRAGFLASLAKTAWGIPPKLMSTLMTTTVHTALDYGVAAWLPFEPPQYFLDKLSIIDHTCARAALGALPSTPAVFLRHDANLIPPKIWIQAKIMNFMASALTKPAHSPIYSFVKQAQNSNPRSHHNPFHRFFQHPVSKELEEFIHQIPLDPSDTLTRPSNYSTVIQENEAMAKADANSLSATLEHVVIFTDGSRIPTSTTAAAAWCKNSDKSVAEHLGPARTYGIYQAEYRGVQIGLQMALRTASIHTRRTTILLDNQGVIKDLRSNKLPISTIDDRKETYKLMNYLLVTFPAMKIAIRWCPGHAGVHGNEIVDKIANTKAKSKLPNTFQAKPNVASFLSAIKEWRSRNAEIADPKDLKRLGHEPHPRRHLKHLSKLKKHSIGFITQLRSGHIHLNHYLCRFVQMQDPGCDCQEGVETVDHYLLVCNRFRNERARLEEELGELELTLNSSILKNPIAFRAIAQYGDSTWRLKSRWDWAAIANEDPYPSPDRQPPRD